MTTDAQEPNRIESLALSLIFAGISVALLLAIGVATRPGSSHADWWTRPALAPGVALGLLAGANLLTLWRRIGDLRASPPTPLEREEARDRFGDWLRPVEYLAYFGLYVWAIQHLGYIPASLIFVLGLLARAGLRSPGWMLAGVALVLALMGIFRIGLGVWMPAPELYDRAPDALRTLLIRYF